MSKKDFVRGVEAQAKANEAFIRKQAAATEELGRRIVQKIDEQGKIIDVVLDELNAQEKKNLYHLQSEFDIATMGENEKEVLASYLLTMISRYGQDADQQKDYYFAVKKHLRVTDVSDQFDLSLVENVDSRAELKAILRTVCEFLFIKQGNAAFLEEFDEEIGCFGFSRKIVREIVESIEEIYRILGIRGIVEHYLPADEEDDGPIEYEKEELIQPITVSGFETRCFANKELEIGTDIRVYGELTFQDCKISLSYLSKCAKITVCNTAKLVFKNCEIVCPERDEHNVGSLIVTEQGDGSLVVFDNCTIHGGQRFIFATGSLQWKHCTILNAPKYFVWVSRGGNNLVAIEDSLIQYDTAWPYGMRMYSHYGNVFNIGGADAVIKNTKIVSTVANDQVEQFVRATESVKRFGMFRPQPTQTIWEDTTGIFAGSFMRKMTFMNCDFEGIESNLLNTDSNGRLALNNCVFDSCRFVNCGKQITSVAKLVNCQTSIESCSAR